MSKFKRGYDKGFQDGVDAIREELGDAIMIIKEEIENDWIRQPARIALITLVNFVNEGEE